MTRSGPYPAGRSPSPAARKSSSAGAGSAARPAGSSFSPLDDRLQLGTEGYSPAVLRKAVFACGNDAFGPASAALGELAGLSISPSHLQRLTRRIGGEWAARRDRDVAAFRAGDLPVASATRAPVASVMVDGGRLQRRAEGGGAGVRDPAWCEFKAACLETRAGRVRLDDPQPDPPGRFLDRGQVARLAAELKANRGAGPAAPERAPRRPLRRGKKAARKRVRTVLASQAGSDAFGWQVAAEVHRRGLHRAANKAYVCDGQKYNWSIWEMHLRPLGFVAVLDFVHLVVYLYAAACAAWGRGTEAAWAGYERWLRQAWSGESGRLLRGLREQGGRLGPPPAGCPEDDRRRAVSEAVGYVENNRSRMDYPRYRKLGLPTSSAGVESTIKRLNRRLKGTEKFWGRGGGEALLTIRAAYLSEDGRAGRHWAQPRPRGRSVGAGRLRARA
jgi:hypothetical protein